MCSRDFQEKVHFLEEEIFPEDVERSSEHLRYREAHHLIAMVNLPRFFGKFFSELTLVIAFGGREWPHGFQKGDSYGKSSVEIGIRWCEFHISWLTRRKETISDCYASISITWMKKSHEIPVQQSRNGFGAVLDLSFCFLDGLVFTILWQIKVV